MGILGRGEKAIRTRTKGGKCVRGVGEGGRLGAIILYRSGNHLSGGARGRFSGVLDRLYRFGRR